jgi:nicotinate-nucleotide adenylyltransferase
MARERIGVFGGTFDPPHVGHLVAAVNVRHALDLDRVLLVVANVPWQKADRVAAGPEDRYAMVAAAVAGVGGLEASRVELDRGGESVTADTLEWLAGSGDPALFLVVGADVAGELGTWRRLDAVQRLATLVVVDRPGAPSGVVCGGWRGVERVEIPHLDVSSTDLRARAAAGLPLDFLVPAPVIALIRQRGLYAGGG